MDHELHVLLLALRQRLIDPSMLAEVASQWSPTSSDGRFLEFLVGTGALSTGDLQRLESIPTERAGPDEPPAPPLPTTSPLTGADANSNSNSNGSATTTATATAMASPATLAGVHAGVPPGLPGFAPTSSHDLPTTDYAPRDLASTVVIPGLDSRPPAEDGRERPRDPDAPRDRDDVSHPGLPRYEILRLHETGGLGQVWRARDRVVGREVALKTLRPDRNTDAARSRFVREAQVTGQLEHPSIVPLYDLAPDGDEPFYVMRFVSGRTLSQQIAEYHRRRQADQVGPLELVGLLEAFVGVCRAVAFAHRHGVLHRDLKGQNVIVGEFGEVFLLDWGLAKHVSELIDPAQAGPAGGGVGGGETTAPGSAVGTPGYMAPEVARGGESTRQSDIYGLGAVLYSLLTGRAPYSGSSVHEVLQKVAESDPAPIPSINPSAPPALQAVCQKAMRRDPAGRYESAEELATEVRRWLADEPVGAYREPWSTRLARWARRHKTGFVGIGIFMATTTLVASASAALLWREEQRTAEARALAERNAEVAQDQRRRAERNAEVARDEQALAERNARLARAVSTEAFDLIQSVEWVLASTEPLHRLRRELLVSGSATFREQLAGDPDDGPLALQTASILRYTANVFRLEGEDRDAEGLYRDSVALLDRLVGQDPDGGGGGDARISLVGALKDWAVLQNRLGPQGRSDALYERSLAALEPLRGPGPDPAGVRRMRAQILVNQAVTLKLLGDGDGSAAASREAIGLFSELLDAPPEDQHPYDALLLARALTLLAVRERDAGRIEEAKVLHAQAAQAFGPLNESTPFGVTEADVAWTAAYCRLERGKTWALDGDPRAWGALDAAVTGFQLLADGFPWVIGYRPGLADALIARAAAKAAAGLPDAADDYDRARSVASLLVEQHPEVPGYRRLLGRGLLGLARTSPDGPDARAERLRQAEQQLLAALEADPEVVEAQEALDEVRAERG